MSFRTVEITGPAEIHVKNGALLIEKEKKAVFSEDREIKEESNDEKKKSKKKTGKEEMEIVRILIPLEDISTIIETARKTPVDHSRLRDTSALQPRQRCLFLLYLPVFSYLRLCSSVCWESMYSLTFSMTVVPVVATK